MAARLAAIAVASATVLSGQEGSNSQPAAETPPAPLYVIQPDDILDIFVWKEEDLSRKVAVRPDGRISLPLVQDLQAAGRTPGELKSAIEARMSEYIDSPNVTVIIDQILHNKVYVTGRVVSPGGFTVPRSITVLQALALAGGFQEFAKKSDIVIVQRIILPEGVPETVVRPFDYDEVVDGKRLSQNILLRPGDVVVVP